jgi:oligoendopeptidase F
MTFSLFRSIIKSVSIERLREVTENYVSLHFYTGNFYKNKYFIGIIDLVLLFAAKEDVSALMTENPVNFIAISYS